MSVFFSFLFRKKSGYVADTVTTGQNLPDMAKLRERERENSIWTNTSLFPLVLGSDLCGVLSWSRLVTTKPPPAFGDPKAPSLSLHCFSLCRYQVICLLGFRLFLSLFLLLLFFFLVLCLSPYTCTIPGQWVQCFFFFFF